MKPDPQKHPVEVIKSICQLRRETPWPKCQDICTVTSAWGVEECKVICEEKFDRKEQPC